MSNCKPGDFGKDLFTGLEINILKNIILKLGWNNSDWDLECVNMNQWYEKLT